MNYFKKTIFSIVASSLFVLFPLAVFAQTNELITPNDQNQSVSNSLDDTLSSMRDITIFSASVKLTGLDKQLVQNGPYTIFVPSDNAIMSLPQSSVSSMTQNDGKLGKTINNHIVQGRITNQDINNQNLKTATGSQLTVKSSDGNVTVNGKKIIGSAQYSNGVIYVIDGVLLPSDVS